MLQPDSRRRRRYGLVTGTASVSPKGAGWTNCKLAAGAIGSQLKPNLTTDMELQHIAFKVFVDGELSVDWEQFINVFHGWVAAQSMPGEMMIDVADYRHVPNGPGVVMTGHEADYYMDNTAGKPGLKYVCKVAQDGSDQDRIQHAFKAAAAACARLEAELPGLKFSRTSFELAVNDRAYAPNNDATRTYLGEQLPAILSSVLGGDPALTLQQDDRKLAGAEVSVASPVEFTAA